MSIRVLVVDDEPLARVGVIARLQAHPDMLVVGECSTGEEAREKIPLVSPDLIFVDVEMPGISGLDLLKDLPKEQACCVVFLTAHEEYALDAFSVEALDYLLKPIDDVRFAACIERARRMFALHRQQFQFERIYEMLNVSEKESQSALIKRFPVRRGNEFTFVPVIDVDWIEGMGDYAGLHAGRRTHLIRESLTRLETRLDPALFVRIHRSTIVQVERIARIDPSFNRDASLTLRDGTVLRVSRTYRAHLDELLHSL
jgi:two-component system, LytTR family, response regulator